MVDPNEFDIEITSNADGAEAVVLVRGEIDLNNAHEIRSIVSVLAGWNETERVVVDLSAVTFMDSSGISALIQCLRDLQKAERHFEVVGATGAALRVLEVTGVLAFLATQPETQAAPNQALTT